MAGWCVCTDSSTTRNRWVRWRGLLCAGQPVALVTTNTLLSVLCALATALFVLIVWCVFCASLKFVVPCPESGLLTCKLISCFLSCPPVFNSPVLPKFCVAYIEKKRFLKGREWSESTQSLDQGRGGVLHAISILPLFRYRYQRLCTQFSFFSK